MEASRPKSKLVVIVGPTASGKSDLALKVARNFSGEIIAADSRTIYKGLDIGTAKPSRQDRKLPHWGIDLIEPGESFTAADFKDYAERKINEIKKRGNLPILVGGSGLYIDGVLFDFEFRPVASLATREQLEKLSVEDLQKLIKKHGYSMPANKQNKRHLIRTIEAAGVTANQKDLRSDAFIVGLLPEENILRQRISHRAEKIFEQGVVEEYKNLVRQRPNIDLQSLGIVYKLCDDVAKGILTEEEAIDKFKNLDWQYARRQKTWFKRNPSIRWCDAAIKAERLISEFLNT